MTDKGDVFNNICQFYLYGILVTKMSRQDDLFTHENDGCGEITFIT